MTFRTLVRLFVLRTIKEERVLTLLSVLGVALGIGLFIGVKIASDRAVASFESGVRGANRYANYEIFHSSGIDFNEQAYRAVLALEDDSFPLLRASGYLPASKETIDVSGIYTVKALRYLPAAPAGQAPEVELFLRTRNGVLVTKKFADRHSLTKGDTITALVYDKTYALTVVGILATEELPAAAMIMDLGNFQEHFGKAGLLSQIDLRTDETTADLIGKMLPPGLAVERKEELVRNQKSLVASFRYNLQFVSFIAILVGIFLLYNTIFISVVKRRTEIGILRSLGARKETIIGLFAVQGMILGLVGSLIGIGLGQAVALFSVAAVERTITTMYGAPALSEYAVTAGDVVKALLLGLAVSLVASAIPAFESSRVKPNESMREGAFESKYKRRQPLLFAGGVLCVLLGGAAAALEYYYIPFDFPYLAYAGMLLIIFGFSFASPFYLGIILKLLKRPAARLLKATGTITIGDMTGNSYRFSVAVMSVAISSALIVSLLILIFSFKGSLEAWITRNVSADVYVKPASCTANFCFYPLSPEVVRTIQGLPEVAGLDRFRTVHVELFGKRVIAGFGDIGVQRKYARSGSFTAKEASRFKELQEKRQVAVSDYLSVKYGLKRGDAVVLPTPKGKKEFIVNDTFSSYSTTSGFLYMDRKWLRQFWGLDDTTQTGVYLKEGVDVDRFIDRLRAGLSEKYSLEIMNSRELRDKILRIFDRSFAITYAIELISIIVSLIGVVTTLLALVLERKRDISILRYLGGDWRRIQCILVLAAGIVGASGAALGALMGPLMSVIFIHVVNKISFGWEIHFNVPYLILSGVMAVVLVTTLLAGLLPSRVARRIDPKRFISYE